MTVDISLIPQERVQDLISTLDNIQNSLSNNLVHKSGDETITGFKTIENNIFLKDTQGTVGTSTNQWARRIQFTDSAGTRIARLEPKYVDTTTLEMGMYASNGTTTENGIWVRNTGETYAPHPTTAQDSSNKIATTAWVNNLDNSVVHKAGNETINGTKTFDDDVVFQNGSDLTTDSSSPFTIIQMGDTAAIANNLNGTYSNIFIKDADNHPIYIGGGCRWNQSNSSNITNGYRHLLWNGTTWVMAEQYSVDTVTGAMATYIQNKYLAAWVIETYANGYAWYRKYSDGWCEQGNCFSGDVNGWQNNKVTLLVPYKNVNYHVSITSSWAGNGDGASYYYANNNKTTTSFTANVTNYAAAYGYATWKASGYYA